MPLFKSRVPAFELDRHVLSWLLVQAVRRSDRTAARDLHGAAVRSLGHEPTWDWWLERCREVAGRDRPEVALLGVEFALDAAVAPWPEPFTEDLDRLEFLAAELRGVLAARADVAGAARLRRPDKCRLPDASQGAAATAG